MPLNSNRTLYTIRNDDLVVELSPSLGASITRFYIDNGADHFDLMRPAVSVDDVDDVLDSSCYPLVPYSGRISGAEFTFQGTRVREPVLERFSPHAIHGHGWRRPWSVIHGDTSHVTLAYHHEADHWPWEYTARQSLRVSPTGLTVILSIHNCSNTAMPAGLGLHPFFPIHGGARIDTRVSGMWRASEDVLPVEHVAIEPSHAFNTGIDPMTTNLDNVFSGWDGQARIDWPDKNLSLEMRSATEYLIIYTPAGADYFCVEPATHPANSFKDLSEVETKTGDQEPAANAEANGYQIVEPMATLGIKVDFEIHRPSR